MEFRLFYFTIKKEIPTFFFLLLAIGCIFLTSKGFVDSETTPKKLWFYGITAIGSLSISIRQIYLKRSLPISKLDWILGVAYLYLLIHSFILGNLNKDTLLFLLSVLLLYLTFKFINLQKYYFSFCIILVFLCTIEALYGFGQFIGFFEKSYSSFNTTGSFDNPAGFSVCLSVIVPFCFYLFEDKRKILKFVSCLSFVIISAMIILSESRTGILTVSILLMVYTFWKFRVYLRFSGKTIGIVLSIILVVIIGFFFLYKMKKDSANGRLLVWSVSYEMIKEKPLVGRGINMFTADYMSRQAGYFKQNPESSFVLLADNVKHPFNEYLLLIIERGFIGLILLITIFSFLIKIFLKDKTFSSFMAFSVLVAIMLFSLFSYPMRYPFVWLMLCLNLAFLSQQAKNRKVINCSFFLLACLLAGYTLISTCFLCRWEYQWKYIARKSLMGMTEEMLPEYEKLYPNMKDNGLFLYNYAAELHYVCNYEKSLQIIEKSERRFNDYDLQMLKADNYFNLKRYDNAEKYFIHALEMCPSRFIPLDNLFDLYKQTGQKDKLIKTATVIHEKPVKIFSEKIFSIKKKAEEILE